VDARIDGDNNQLGWWWIKTRWPVGVPVRSVDGGILRPLSVATVPAMQDEKSRFHYVYPMIIMLLKFFCYGAPLHVVWTKCIVLLVESSHNDVSHILCLRDRIKD
jgi:hypothetical protein